MSKTDSRRKPLGIKVKARSGLEIRESSAFVRDFLEITEPWVDVVRLYEFQLAELGLEYDYIHPEELDGCEGQALPDSAIIQIREDVYEGACLDMPKDRFTLCHELGHLVLHVNQSSFRRASAGNQGHEWYEDSEWQANTFASEFLMPVQHVKTLCKSSRDIVKIFGVSISAASYRWKNLKEEGLV